MFVALADNVNQGIFPVSVGATPLLWTTNLMGAGSVRAVGGDRWLDEKGKRGIVFARLPPDAKTKY